MTLPQDSIRLTLPARAPFARVARLAVAGLAARNGFSYDEVEDIRIAVGEVFGVLVADDLRLRITCALGPAGVEVLAERVPPTEVAPLGDLSHQILSAVTDRAQVDEARGAISFAKRSDLAA